LPSKSPVVLYKPTPLTKTRLKSGKKINVFVGPKGDSFIGIEGAYVSLLVHYWGFAEVKLINGASTLFIQDGIKPTVQWMYAYILAGEKDKECHVKIDSMTISQLVDLYDHSAYLGYESLKTRVFGLLRHQLYNTFPNVLEMYHISLVVPKLNDFVLKLVVARFTQPLAFDYTPYMEYVRRDTEFGAILDSAVGETLERLITRSVKYYNGPHFARHLQGVGKSSASLNRAAISKNNDKQTSTSIGKRSGKVVEKSPAAVNSKQVQASTAGSSEAKSKGGSRKTKMNKNRQLSAESIAFATTSVNSTRAEAYRRTQSCHRYIGEGHFGPGRETILDRADPMEVANEASEKIVRKLSTCYNCKAQGHIARDCKASTFNPPTCYKCNGQGHLSRNCETPKVEPRTRKPPTCYNCSETGHISRSCPYTTKMAGPDTYANTPRPESGRGRNMNPRRARADRYYDHTRQIELAADGEGVKTCTREVKTGEYTRTGVYI
jgi:hypothetical protein